MLEISLAYYLPITVWEEMDSCLSKWMEWFLTENWILEIQIVGENVLWVFVFNINHIYPPKEYWVLSFVL